MPKISRRDLVLLLIGLGKDGTAGEGLSGMTRLQKYLFVLQREGGLQPEGDGFRFEAYKAGPYSSKLYDDIEFLENLGYLHAQVTGGATESEEAELEALSLSDLFGEQSDAHPNPKNREDSPPFEERSFTLTEKGRQKVGELVSNVESREIIDGVRKVKSRFANYSLNDLLRYVYQRYPEMTTESEIIDKVLGRKRSP
jgi:hypothetical protein